jgi:uncharacterized protein YcbX
VEGRNGEARVSRISIAPVKGLALQALDAVELGRHGVAENRRLHLVEASGRLVNTKMTRRLMLVASRLDLGAGTLALRFPGGAEVAAELALGEPITTAFGRRPVSGHVLVGPWGPALSDWAGIDLRLVMSDEVGAANDRGRRAVASIVSEASVAAVAKAGGADWLDSRRFRMLFEVEGVGAHDEDAWIGRDLAIGGAVLRPRGNVGRCAITTLDPETAERDFDTLRVLAGYRGDVETTEPLPLGIVGEVLTPGQVRLGDAVRPVAP